MAEAVTPLRNGGLDDLDAPWRVAAVMREDRRHFSGVQIGTWKGRALLAWPKEGSRDPSR